MDYGSVTSGIEAATVAWHSLGWRAAWFSEIEPFPCRLLKYYYPDVPNLGDMLKLTQNKIFNESNIDVLVGGTPCQSFSLAGLRGGLATQNGNLALEFCRLLIAKRPLWFVWENVPGVFSSFSDETDRPILDGVGPEYGRDITQTADFATLLTAFQQCGYCCAWRVLDSQYFGVPQRRRRVFVVGHFGDDWRPPAAVLFERHSLLGDITEVEKEKQDIAGTLDAGTGRRRGAGTSPAIITPCWWDGSQLSQTIDAVLYKGQSMPEKNRFPAVLWSAKAQNSGKDFVVKAQNIASPIETKLRFGNQGGDMIQNGLQVRRLTPLECERLQGFPDNYTKIPKSSDGARYKALGNSMTVQVMRWIGERIQKVDSLLKL